jgi:hypothetical protein
MSIEDIRALRNAKPFRPFTICMKDGRTLEVERPERLALSHRGHQVSLFHGDKLSLLDVQGIRRLEEGSESILA